MSFFSSTSSFSISSDCSSSSSSSHKSLRNNNKNNISDKRSHHRDRERDPEEDDDNSLVGLSELETTFTMPTISDSSSSCCGNSFDLHQDQKSISKYLEPRPMIEIVEPRRNVEKLAFQQKKIKANNQIAGGGELLDRNDEPAEEKQMDRDADEDSAQFTTEKVLEQYLNETDGDFGSEPKLLMANISQFDDERNNNDDDEEEEKEEVISNELFDKSDNIENRNGAKSLTRECNEIRLVPSRLKPIHHHANRHRNSRRPEQANSECAIRSEQNKNRINEKNITTNFCQDFANKIRFDRKQKSEKHGDENCDTSNYEIHTSCAADADAAAAARRSSSVSSFTRDLLALRRERQEERRRLRNDSAAQCSNNDDKSNNGIHSNNNRNQDDNLDGGCGRTKFASSSAVKQRKKMAPKKCIQKNVANRSNNDIKNNTNTDNSKRSNLKCGNTSATYPNPWAYYYPYYPVPILACPPNVGFNPSPPGQPDQLLPPPPPPGGYYSGPVIMFPLFPYPGNNPGIGTKIEPISAASIANVGDGDPFKLPSFSYWKTLISQNRKTNLAKKAKKSKVAVSGNNNYSSSGKIENKLSSDNGQNIGSKSLQNVKEKMKKKAQKVTVSQVRRSVLSPYLSGAAPVVMALQKDKIISADNIRANNCDAARAAGGTGAGFRRRLCKK